MEFGRLGRREFESLDFRLRNEWKQNKAILSGHMTGKTKVFVGCAKWGRKDWVGKIYPPGTRQDDFLNLYSRNFKCIELNATFYKIPTRAQTETWRSKVESDFLFCPKVSQSITHIRRLKNAREVTDRFIEGISGFGSNLGPVFLVPHPGMGPDTFERVKQFVEEFPKEMKLFVELRHEDWYCDPYVFEELCMMLHENNTGFVITDASGRRDCAHMRLTTPKAFIRFVGNALHPTDYLRIDDWVRRIGRWIDAGIEEVYFFMHQHDELHSPELCRYLIQQLNLKCNTQIPVPAFLGAPSFVSKRQQAAKR